MYPLKSRKNGLKCAKNALIGRVQGAKNAVVR